MLLMGRMSHILTDAVCKVPDNSLLSQANGGSQYERSEKERPLIGKFMQLALKNLLKCLRIHFFH